MSPVAAVISPGGFSWVGGTAGLYSGERMGVGGER